MRYFVTGATGFVGGQVARQLIAAGHGVVAPVRTPAKAQDLAALGVDVRQGDVTEKESMREAMRGVDGVFHIAGWYKLGVKDKSEGERINIQGTRNVLELMRELEIPKGVYTSTLAVFSDTHGRMVDETYRYDGPHLSEYDRTKWVAHYEVADPMIAAGPAPGDRPARVDLWSRRHQQRAHDADLLSQAQTADGPTWHGVLLGACRGYGAWAHSGDGAWSRGRSLYHRGGAL